ncbi:hypothetical protein BS78_09G229100 [Paspalum vaginatum]|nr:hypothetical protein BS78_09G229100 [Paspalum vaginatum]
MHFRWPFCQFHLYASHGSWLRMLLNSSILDGCSTTNKTFKPEWSSAIHDILYTHILLENGLSLMVYYVEEWPVTDRKCGINYIGNLIPSTRTVEALACVMLVHLCYFIIVCFFYRFHYSRYVCFYHLCSCKYMYRCPHVTDDFSHDTPSVHLSSVNNFQTERCIQFMIFFSQYGMRFISDGKLYSIF